MDCIFCQIINGKIESSVVFQDELVFAMMDIRPINPGHLLVLPKKHAENLEQLDDQSAARMFTTAKTIAASLRKSELKCEGINLFLADGRAAGQEVFHCHLHVLPRFSGDGFELKIPKISPPTRDELNRIANEIKTKL